MCPAALGPPPLRKQADLPQSTKELSTFGFSYKNGDTHLLDEDSIYLNW